MKLADLIFHGVFFVIVFAVPIFLAWASASESDRLKRINVSGLWTDKDGRLDMLKTIVLGTWWIHSCAVILWILTRTINDANVTQYMGWALTIIARMFAPSGRDTSKAETAA